MKIFVEVVFMANFVINFFILKTVAVWLNVKGRFVVATSCVGAIATTILPLLNLTMAGQLLFEIGIWTILLCFSFSFQKIRQFLKIFCVTILANFLFGGVAFFASNFNDNLFVVVMFVVAVFVFVKIAWKNFNKKCGIRKFKVDVTIFHKKKIVQCEAFFDSGNLLFDSLTNLPVNFVDKTIFEKIFGKIEDISQINADCVHFINLNTLSSSDKILVFQVERMIVNGVVVEKPMFGLSTADFAKNLESDVILHNQLAIKGVL